ncbi:MAG: thermonuclease family protein [Desulfovibrio sp.]|nr:thermonuclease family protein [Desulfovibrio sp.]
MKAKSALAALLLLPVFCGLAMGEEEGAILEKDGVVVKCFDGDTFQMMDRRIIRLAGIDAPETPRGTNQAQYHARRSRKILEDLLRGQKITLSIPGTKRRDNWGRYLAEAKRAPNEPSINEQLVALGAAFFYPHEDLGPDFQERLSRLQTEAINERRGLWAYLLSHPVAEKRYVGNRDTLRFFPEDCAAASQIKPRNRVNFGNLMDAFLAGYAPSRVCPFWPDAVGDKKDPSPSEGATR